MRMSGGLEAEREVGCEEEKVKDRCKYGAEGGAL